MDAEVHNSIRVEVQNALTTSQNTMMTEMRNLISQEVGRIHTLNEKLAENQLSKIEDTIGESHKFKKRGNEEQFKHNNKVLMKLQEAESSMSGTISDEKIVTCRTKISEGMTLIKHRQKLIKLADSTDSGWRLVQGYESNPLASDSEDEKRIFKAQARAERKIKAEKAKRKESTKRFHPYSAGGSGGEKIPTVVSTGPKFPRPGRCFNCGGKGHWKRECTEEPQAQDKMSTIYNFSSFDKSTVKEPLLYVNRI